MILVRFAILIKACQRRRTKIFPSILFLSCSGTNFLLDWQVLQKKSFEVEGIEPGTS